MMQYKEVPQEVIEQLQAEARTLAMRIASLPLLQQEAVLSVLVTEMDRRRLTPTSPTLMPLGPTAGRDA